MNDYQACYRQIEGLYQDTAIRDRRYYPDFRRSWDALLRRAADDALAAIRRSAISSEAELPPWAVGKRSG